MAVSSHANARGIAMQIDRLNSDAGRFKIFAALHAQGSSSKPAPSSSASPGKLGEAGGVADV